jgi:hypothetical protein
MSPPASSPPGPSSEAGIIRKSYGGIEAAFAAGDDIVGLDLSVGRHSGVPLETRHDPATSVVELYGAAKIPHVTHNLLGRDPATVHLHEGHVGGGFGISSERYPEDVIFSSDVGHFDVPDTRVVLPDALELVEDELITKDDFRDFTFTNAVRLWGTQNPDFFAGHCHRRTSRRSAGAQRRPCRRGVGARPVPERSGSASPPHCKCGGDACANRGSRPGAVRAQRAKGQKLIAATAVAEALINVARAYVTTVLSQPDTNSPAKC